MHIELLRADITSLKLDAMVNESAPGSVPVGQATVTTGGNLLCRFIIHASVPRGGEDGVEAKLRAATMSALERAEELAISSVGMPPLGVQTLPVERAAQIVLQAALDFRSHARSLQRVVFCLFGADAHDTFERVLRELEP
jgi:O-acetyl-ADP-ribose deacetylase (regulator of RNase III)